MDRSMHRPVSISSINMLHLHLHTLHFCLSNGNLCDPTPFIIILYTKIIIIIVKFLVNAMRSAQ